MNQNVAEVVELLEAKKTPQGLHLDVEQAHRLIFFLNRVGEMLSTQESVIKKLSKPAFLDQALNEGDGVYRP